MFKSKKIILLLVMIVGVSLLLSGCTGGNNQTKFEKIKEEGKIVLGTAADYPPYEFHKQIDGEDQIVGFDIEIAKEIANDLDVDLEIKDMKFDGLLAALKAGNIDFIIAGMVPTEERAESVDFSIPYYEAEQSFLTKVENKSNYKKMSDLNGLKIGAQKATTQENIAKTKIDASEYKFISKITDLVLELKNDKIDGIVLVKPVAESYAKANGDLAVADFMLGKEDSIAIAVDKGNEALMKEINSSLERLLEKNKITEFIAEATKLAESNQD
ncbi:amino acid ABC transporter substrate-binding protein (PAAT family) [Halanaerobium saccharolyticum]|uniref:Amino acid ABC transporter substrate-binding protein (PAAT family) n=1 Tax=Halanaerobium saccharolyticum TaxID=43595 RepID=A0A4R7YZE2_9FIRM|nr:transporter substrate-binding domain-containing protein [Halanaerobium saccharolyticum]RAK06919.1 amino acid ABC transporter substrate-binding protein (PAAT family) [Halanaerobium saccharolyticum]TDW01646.1 amino acid ABC transporter substrate-binding protein (PAAT family) [Halanaerobium saccharolyticum]TDX53044.1 amino acid ABC transporter substrate-binding protein (PAAT family) [Halanaerobium saccharolyticum]